MELPGQPPPSVCEALVQAGARKLDLPEMFDAVTAPGGTRTADQVELACYSQLSDCLAHLKLKAAGSQAMRYLAEHPVY